MQTDKNLFKFIDLFAGIGGFHIALDELGGRCVFSSEIDEEARKVYENNFGVHVDGDIKKIDEEDIPSHNILCAGFPCQPFSKAGERRGLEETRGTLFYDIVRIAKYHKPEYMILENVRNLVGHDNGKTWRIIKQKIREIGYIVPHKPFILSPHNLGIPQHRKRVLILCQREDLAYQKNISIEELPQTPDTNVEDILLRSDEVENVSKYAMKEKNIRIVNIWNEFIKGIPGKPPSFPVWPDWFNKPSPEGLPSWKSKIVKRNKEMYSKNKDFIDAWLKRHNHLRDIPKSRRKLEWQAGNSKKDIWSLIFQLRPSGLRVKRKNYFPALVAMTQTPFVGKQKRKLTPREAARLQSFPDDYTLHEKESIAFKQLGNAVNVMVVQYASIRLIDYRNFLPKEESLPESEKKVIEDIKRLNNVITLDKWAV